jgi:hypothetical protein
MSAYNNKWWLEICSLFAVVGILIGNFPNETGEQRQKRHRHNTNVAGILAMLAVAVVVISLIAVKHAEEQQKIRLAEVQSVALANKFAEVNLPVMMQWAKGEKVDPWDNSYILVVSNDKEIRMVSMGPDGEHPTEDDIVGLSTVNPIPRIKKFDKIEQPGMMESLKKKFWSSSEEEVKEVVKKKKPVLEIEVDKKVIAEVVEEVIAPEKDDPGLFDSIKDKIKFKWSTSDEK